MTAAVSSSPVRNALARGIAGLRRPRMLWLAWAWLGLIAAVGVLANVLPFLDPNDIQLLDARQGPSAEHWLGTDSLGRDLLARMAYGARIDLLVAIGVIAIGGVLGCILGMIAGYSSRPAAVILWLADTILAFPALILAVALAAFLGPSLPNVVLVISIVAMPTFIRVARAGTLQVRDRDFVLAARAYGSTAPRIIALQIWPNIRRTMIGFSLMIAAVAIIIEGALSFLGAGVPQPQASWGGMIAEGVASLTVAPLQSLLPAAALVLTVLALNAVGESGDEATTARVV